MNNHTLEPNFCKPEPKSQFYCLFIRDGFYIPLPKSEYYLGLKVNFSLDFMAPIYHHFIGVIKWS